MSFLVRLDGIKQPYYPGALRSARRSERVAASAPIHPIHSGNTEESAIKSNPYERDSSAMGSRRTPVMLARDLMKAPVLTGSPSQTGLEILEIFHKHRYRHIPIVDESGSIVGIVSDRDLLRINDLGSTHVSGIMHSSVLTAEPITPIKDIVRVMFEERIGCTPIVENERTVGIITRSDILRAILTGAPLDLWS